MGTAAKEMDLGAGKLGAAAVPFHRTEEVEGAGGRISTWWPPDVGGGSHRGQGEENKQTKRTGMVASGRIMDFGGRTKR